MNRRDRRRQQKLEKTQGRHPDTGALEQAVRSFENGNPDDAGRRCRALLAEQPDFWEALQLLGAASFQTGDAAGAVDAFRRALELRPDDADAHFNLGLAQQEAGDLAAATASYRQALARQADHDAALNNLGAVLLLSGGDPMEAADLLGRATIASPNNGQVHYNHANALKRLGRVEEAAEGYRRAMELDPTDTRATIGLGNLLDDQGRAEDAIAVFEQAEAGDPTSVPAKWGARLTLPIIYDDAAEMATWRERWAAGLDRLAAEVDLNSPAGVASALEAVTAKTNFNLHYQGRVDRDLQAAYGNLVHRIVGAAYPDCVQPLAKRARAPGEPIRVGFVSSFLRHHTVAKLFGGWMTGLDPERFQVHAFHAGSDSDETTERLTAGVHAFHQNLFPDSRLIGTIREAALDALIFTDIGMDARMQLLAAMRLAPVQAVTWGHPVTTGLPTIDHFLTSAMMEPANGDAHYTERLDRLGNLSISYARPATNGLAPLSLAGKGPHLLCTQSLFKLLPWFDAVLAAIAEAAPAAQFHFVAAANEDLTARFRRRLEASFTARAQDAGRIAIHPTMGQDDFFRLNLAADLVLDSPDWSGGNTTLEAVACGKPVVTLAGETMRSRHSAAILKRLDIEDTIATNGDDYAAIVAALANDEERRRQLTARVAESADRVFEDQTPVDDLEEFLIQATA